MFIDTGLECFRLTIRNVNQEARRTERLMGACFRLTIRNVNLNDWAEKGHLTFVLD